MSHHKVASAFSGVLALGLWFLSILLLRVTPLTRAAFLLASLGLTMCLAALGWAILTLVERLGPRRNG